MNKACVQNVPFSKTLNVKLCFCCHYVVCSVSTVLCNNLRQRNAVKISKRIRSNLPT